MLRYALIFSTLLFSSFSLSAVDRGTEKNPALDETTKKVIVSRANPEVKMNLYSNASTGYSWYIRDIDMNLLTIKKHEYNADFKTTPGKGGREYWTFKVKEEALVAPMITKITMVYIQPWKAEQYMNGKGKAQEVVFSVITSD